MGGRVSRRMAVLAAVAVLAAGCSTGDGKANAPAGAQENAVSTVPSAPRNVEANAYFSGRVDVKWKKPDNEGSSDITSYTVTASPGGMTCTTKKKKCQVSGLTYFKRYTFTVVATNSSGSSEPSAPTKEVIAPGDMPAGGF